MSYTRFPVFDYFVVNRALAGEMLLLHAKGRLPLSLLLSLASLWSSHNIRKRGKTQGNIRSFVVVGGSGSCIGGNPKSFGACSINKIIPTLVAKLDSTGRDIILSVTKKNQTINQKRSQSEHGRADIFTSCGTLGSL